MNVAKYFNAKLQTRVVSDISAALTPGHVVAISLEITQELKFSRLFANDFEVRFAKPLEVRLLNIVLLVSDS